MCSTAEWEAFVRRVESAAEEGRAREFVAEALARVDALIDEFIGRTCSPESADWACGHRRRPRPDWIV